MLGKITYGLCFCLVLPLLLAAWAVALENKLPGLPPVAAPWAGGIVALAGLLLMLGGMADLWRRGGGLPMNAFPPPRLVSAGTYRLVPHPIYCGCGLLVPGAALAAGVAAGVWLVTPAVWLGMLALVLGYERIDLERRFGANRTTPLLWLPPARDTAPSVAEKLAATLLAFGPWLLGYQAVALLGTTPLAFDTRFPFEKNWPVLEWAAPLYLGAYLWTAAAPWLARSRRELRVWLRDAWWGTGVILWLFLALPFIAPPLDFTPQTFLGEWILLDRSWDTAACAFPSFHVFWGCMAARLWAGRIGIVPAALVAGGIAASCVLAGNHSLADVAAGGAVFWGATRCEKIWKILLRGTERIANSWRDWRAGPVRIINHGAYVGLAVLSGLLIVGTLLGGGHTAPVVTVALCSLFGAGLWGQWLEASSALSRPFGYFGGLFGGLAGVVLAQAVWSEGWLLLGAFAVAAPVIQAVGRLRCLVQGCCHGRPATPAAAGIHYHRPLSRVVKIAGLKNVPVYPTPLYSILANGVIFALLLRLWLERADGAFIAGAYLLLSTCARFVEEAYRGEPQTARWGGLAIYQWLAVGCLLAGMALLACPAPPVPAWTGWSAVPFAYGVPLGLLAWFFMGVDFPESRRRMSRLA